jgi:hypothetical protein
MTLEFAKTEAKRRTDVLGTTHYAIKAESMRDSVDGYMVTTFVPFGYVSVATFYAPVTEPNAGIPTDYLTLRKGYADGRFTDCESCGRTMHRDRGCICESDE